MTPVPDNQIKLKDVERLVLAPSDVLVLHVPAATQAGDCDLMRRHLESKFPDNKVLILAGDVKLKVYSQGSSLEREPEWASEETVAKAMKNPMRWSA